DWRELRPSAEQPWDRLCDALHGEGVPSVDAALAMLRLRPLHNALHQALNPESIRAFAEIAEELAARRTGNAMEELSAAAVVDTPQDPQFRASQLQAFLDQCNLFFQRAVASLPAENRELAARIATGSERATDSYREACQRRTVAAIHLGLLKNKFAQDWPSIARLAPESTREWARVAAWIVIGSLPWKADNVAAFDSLQLRQALASVFSAIGMEGEEVWRGAAEIRTLLLDAEAPDPRAF